MTAAPALVPATKPRTPPGPATRTYRYLRLALVGTVVVIFAGVFVQMAQGSFLSSISAYYYTGAQIPFVGALFAAALTLITLAGSGSGRVLLSIAAIFAPIIALVPTPLIHGAVPTFADDCGITSCVPSNYRPEVITGVWTYVVVGVLIIATLLVLAARRSISWAPTILVVGILAIVVLVLAIGWSLAPSFILRFAHFSSAGIFFVLIGIVALHNARAPKKGNDGQDGYVQAYRIHAPHRSARVLYIIVAVGEVANLVVFTIAFILKWPIIYDESVALVLFLVFWLNQTLETVELFGKGPTIDPDGSVRAAAAS